MNTIRITTTQNIELEFDLANVGERLVAWILDAVIFFAYFLLSFFLINFLSSIEKLFSKAPWVIVLIMAPFVFYNLVCDIWLNGQTIGKRVMNIRVISLNGEQARFSQYLIRWLFRLVDIYLFNALPAFICVIVSDKKQRIGDLVAGTVVIRTVPRMQLQQTIYVPTGELNYDVKFPQVTQLSDRDMQLIKEVINNVKKTGNVQVAYQAAEKVKLLLQVQNDWDALYFLETILLDYNYLTSRM